MKESVIPTARTVRSRFQRPRPNIRKTGQRQIEKGEAESVIKEERTIVQKDETKKFLTAVSYCYVNWAFSCVLKYEMAAQTEFRI